MYARFFTFRSTPANRKKIEALADHIYAFTREQPGFVSATYLVSLDETEYRSMTLWSSLEAAEAAATAIRGVIGDRLDAVATAAPEVGVMEVYEPARS